MKDCACFLWSFACARSSFRPCQYQFRGKAILTQANGIGSLPSTATSASTCAFANLGDGETLTG